jgi:hypothetical protein
LCSRIAGEKGADHREIPGGSVLWTIIVIVVIVFAVIGLLAVLRGRA